MRGREGRREGRREHFFLIIIVNKYVHGTSMKKYFYYLRLTSRC